MTKAYSPFVVVVLLLPTVLSCSERQPAIDTYNRGIAYHDKGELDKAVADFTGAIGLDPHDPLAYSHRATAYRELGDEEKAAEDERKAQELGKRE